MIVFAAYSVFTAAEMDNRPTFWEFLDELTAEAIPKMKEEKVCFLFVYLCGPLAFCRAPMPLTDMAHLRVIGTYTPTLTAVQESRPQRQTRKEEKREVQTKTFPF